MKVTLLNYAVPERQREGKTRWWHKSGSRWPASIVDRSNDGSGYFPWPFLLGYLHSLLASEGHEVTTIDACVLKLELPDVVARVRASAPELIIFETSEQTERGDAQILSALHGLAPVVLIGPNVHETRADLLGWPGVEAMVPGEYLVAVADFLRDRKPGIAPRREVRSVAEMDALPPAYRDPDLIPRYSARFKTTPPGVQGQFVSMWGCQYRCEFCIWIHSYWPKSSQIQKHFSHERLELELDQLLRQHPEVTSLYDDADNHHYRDRHDALAYGELLGRKQLRWALLTRADSYMIDDAVDRELWRSWAEQGCYAVKIGIEGDQEVADATNKRLDIDVVREFVAVLQDLGIQVYASFMLNVPGVDAAADARTLALIDELAGRKPALFEYFVSVCDITAVTPFGAAATRGDVDGQAGFEQLVDAGFVDVSRLRQRPINLRQESD